MLCFHSACRAIVVMFKCCATKTMSVMTTPNCYDLPHAGKIGKKKQAELRLTTFSNDLTIARYQICILCTGICTSATASCHCLRIKALDVRKYNEIYGFHELPCRPWDQESANVYVENGTSCNYDDKDTMNCPR